MKKAQGLRLTQERLKEIIHYDPKTGSMTWKRHASNDRGKRTPGRALGTLGGNGYIQVVIDREVLLGHRVAWMYHYGEWPRSMVTFIDGDKENIRIANLRLKEKGAVAKADPTQEQIREVLDYDPLTGKFTWKKSLSQRTPVGSEAGATTKIGYVIISAFGKKYLAHRLAWFYMHNEWPPEHIDHINGVRNDNRIENLRPATFMENARNSGVRSTNKSGLKGVSWSSRRQKWHARIVANYRTYVLGYFDTKEEAHEAYKRAASRLHGVFANVGIAN